MGGKCLFATKGSIFCRLAVICVLRIEPEKKFYFVIMGFEFNSCGFMLKIFQAVECFIFNTNMAIFCHSRRNKGDIDSIVIIFCKYTNFLQRMGVINTNEVIDSKLSSGIGSPSNFIVCVLGKEGSNF